MGCNYGLVEKLIVVNNIVAYFASSEIWNLKKNIKKLSQFLFKIITTYFI